MCDCFHVVLPTWPGAPGSVSGRPLQPQEPGAATDEEHSVTEGPVDEIIRPRPQGSSPVYECTTEGAGFGVQEDAPGRRGSSGRRRSWWKRDSGDSRVFSRMSHPEAVQEAAEVTMETEVEAGASGYSVTGGGHQGIFVKQVLKDSSAAKLFSLREGDQLLSATIFFDDIKYEDALKILQYSEPYKIQFRIKRRLPATESEELAVVGPLRGSKAEEQHEDIADQCTGTPTKMPEADGDRERLISKPRMSRGRRPQERLSWPKFQAMKGKRGPGPRRSHSSSDAYEPDAPDLSPTRTDTEAQLPEELQEPGAGPGHQRRRRFLNFRFKMGSGQEPSAAGHLGREAQGRLHPPGVLGERGPWDDGPEDMGAAAGGKSEGKAQSPEARAELPVQQSMEPGLPAHELGDRAPGEGAGMAARGQRKTQWVSSQHKAGTHSDPRPGTDTGPGMSWTEEWEEVQSLEMGTARLPLLDTGESGSTQTHPPGTQVQTWDVKTPKSGISKEKVPKTERRGKGLEQRRRKQTSPGQDDGGKTQATAGKDRPVAWGTGKEQGTEETSETLQEKVETPEGKDRDRTEVKGKMPRFKMSSLGWSPTREATASQSRAGKEDTEDKRPRDKTVTAGPHKPTTDREEMPTQEGEPENLPTMASQKDNATLEKNIKKGDREPAGRDSKFKMPKFKMPSFSMSASGKALDTTAEVTAPMVEASMPLPSLEGELKSSDLSIQLPAANMDARAAQVAVTLPETTLPEGELPKAHMPGAGLKGHMPTLQIPSIKMPKVEIRGPQVDIKGPKVDIRGPTGEVSTPAQDMEMPSMQVDIQAPEVKLEGDLDLAEKEVAIRDSKFKMPKFKMPSFGLSAPTKGLDTSLEVKVPKVEAEVALPSIQGDLKGSDLNTQLPSTDLDARAIQVGVTLPEATLPEGELPEAPATGLGMKGHVPKVQMPSIKMPKVDLKGPQVDLKGPQMDIKGPKVDVKGPKVEVSAPALDVEMPSVQVDIQAPGATLEGDLSLAEKEVAIRDSKFKMPKFKMPSFGLSAPTKGLDTSLEVKVPKVEAEVALPSIQGDLKGSDLTTQLPSTDLDARAVQVGVTLPEATLPEGELPEAPATGLGMKGHVPKVQMPSIKMPKVDLKDPQVDIKGPKVDVKGPKVEVSAPALDVEMPSVQVDIQALGATLEGDLSLAEKEVASRESKFKMPKFKMPSFGLSAPTKGLDTSLEVKVPKVEAQVALPSIQGDLKGSDLTIQLPSTDLDATAVQVGVTLPEATLPEGELPEAPATGLGMKGHVPKVQMPSIKMPKVDLKGPQVDIKGPQVDIKGPKVDVKGPKAEVSTPALDVEMPSVQVDIQALDTNLEGDMALGVKEVASRESKFKMPKFKMPSFGVSAPARVMDGSVELTTPKVERDVVLPSIQGDFKGSDLTIQLPSTDLDARAVQVGLPLPEATLPEGELPEAPVSGAGLKVHLPKWQKPSKKMPKVELKGPQMDIKGPKVEVKGPKGDVSTPSLDMEMPSVQVDIQAPDTKLERDLALAEKDVASRDSKFKMPKFKMPSFSMSASGKALDTTAEVTAPMVEASMPLPSLEGELKSSDLSIQLPTDNMDARAAQVAVTLPETTLPEGELPKAHVPGAGLKGHMPTLQMSSIKMPKVEIRGPQVDIKGPKVDIRGPTGEVSTPAQDMEMPSMQVDIQAPDAKLEGDLALAEKEVAIRDSKFKMPKFTMPSFGLSAPTKGLDTSLEVKVPKVEAQVALPPIQGELKGSDLTIQLPSTDLDARAVQVGVTLPEATLPEGELPEAPATGLGMKGHVPKVQMPSIKMPKVDLKGPQVDIKGPQVDIKDPKVDVKGPKVEVSAPALDVEMPSVQVDIQAPGATLEGDLSLAEKEVASRESKFKMPKFKMPSFGLSAPTKGLDTSLEVKVPKVEAQVALPSIQGDLKGSDLTIQLPSTDLDARAVQVGVTLPEATLPEGELPEAPATGLGMKGHVPKVQMPSIKMPKVDLKGPQVDLKGPQVDFKGPQVDIKGPKVDVKGPKAEVGTPALDVEMPSVQVDIQAPGATLEGDLSLEEKNVASRDSKFKMPKFKMPSFGVSALAKGMDGSVEVTAPKVETEVPLPSTQGDLKSLDHSIKWSSTDLDPRSVQKGVTFPEVTLAEGELPEASVPGAGLKDHLFQLQKPSIKMSKVDLKGPQVDIKGPKVEVQGPKGDVRAPTLDVEMPSMQMNIQAPDEKLEGDLALAEKDMPRRDSKFKMPKFKMPSFGVSVPANALDTTLEVKVPKVEVEVALPSIQGDLKGSDLTIQLPSTDLDARAVQVGVTLPEATLPEGVLPEAPATGLGMKGHVPKVQMPSIKMPKVDFKGSQVDIKGPKVDVKGPKAEVSTPALDVEVPSVQVDIQAPGATLKGDLVLEEKDVSSRDSKFKMPKFKMPSFGVSAPGKGLDTSLEVKGHKVEAEVALPSIQGDLKSSDLSIQLPSTDLDARAMQVGVTLQEATLPEGELPEAPATGRGMKGHVPKVQMPRIKMPKVDLKGPQVDIKGPKVDVKGPKGDVSTPTLDLEMPSMQMDIQAPDAELDGDLALAEKDVASRDRKFKMPKFKMPSFGVSATAKAMDGSVEVTAPKVETDVALPSIQGDLKSPDLSIQLPSTDLDATAMQVGVTLPEATLPEGELPEAPATGLGMKGHVPKVQMPRIKMPKVDLKGPQVDIKGPKVDVKGPKGDVSTPTLDLEMPSMQMDIQAPDAKLEGDLALAEKDVASRDLKLKMPKFKMPSFGLSAPAKGLDTSLEVKVPKVEAEMALPSIQGDLKGSELTIQLPSTDLDARAMQVGVTLPEATLPEGELPEAPAIGLGMKDHVPKVQMPSIKMPKVDLKGPQVDIKVPTVDMHGPKGEVSASTLDVEMPSMQMDYQAPDVKLEGDLALAEKDVASKDSKFKVPKFKMPSVSVSAAAKAMDGSVEVTAPKVETDMALPSIQGDLKSSDLSIQLLSTDLDATAAQVGMTLPEPTLPAGELPEDPATGLGMKGHVPKVQMPRIKMPKVDLKGLQVDIKGSKVDVKGPKGDVSTPTLDVEMPSVQVDIKVPDAKLEGDLALEGKEVASRDLKVKMPKFKMPSFGLSAPVNGVDPSVKVKVPKVEAEVALPSIQGDLKGSDLTIQLPSTDLDARAMQVGVTLPDATLPEGELPEAPAMGLGMKGHVPKVQMPSIKMPKVDLKGPKVDVKGPKGDVSTPTLDVEMPSMQMDIQAPDAELEGDLALAEKDVASRDRKFKMPKLRMPSFGVSAAAKAMDGSVEVTVPKVEIDVALPSIQGDLKSSDLTIQLPSTDLDATAAQVGMTLPEPTLPEGELPEAPATELGMKGHVPKVQMPSIKMPKVDLKGPQVDIKGPKVDVKGPKGDVSTPTLDVEMPSMQMDIQAPDAKLEGDLALAEKDVASSDFKLKMPKFKMPSFGLSAPAKGLDPSVKVKVPKVEAEVALPSIQGDLKSSDLSIQLPSTHLDARAMQVDVTLPEATLPEGELPEASAMGLGMKGHVPKVQMPSIKMPKVDLKGPKVDVKGPKGDVSTPTLDVEMPSMQMDIQAPDAELEGDLALAEKDVASRDRKFKMPKFKMPSFGVSATAKAMDGSVEVTVPKVDSDVALPSIQEDLKCPDLSIQLPSTVLDATAMQVGVTLPEATLPEGELPEAPATGLGMKGHVPKVQMPRIKMPKVDLKGPQVDIKGPKVDVKGPKGDVSTPTLDLEMPSMQMDIQAPDAKLEGDLALAEKDVASRDLKLKMPKFKMPSFGLSAPAKGLDTSLEVKVPKVEAEMALPSIQGDLKSSDLTIQLPSTDLDARAMQVGVTLPEATLPEGELPEAPAIGLGMKDHVPKVQMPSIKMPKVDLKGPQVDIKGSTVDMHGPKGEVSASTLDVEMPSMQMDYQAPDVKLEGDLALAEKDVARKDSKFKVPKFKMPSVGVSAAAKAMDGSVEVTAPKVEADVALPSIQGDLKSSDLSIQLPSTDLDATATQVSMTLPDATLPAGELLEDPATGLGMKGHVPKVQMPRIKMPKVDLKGLQVDIKGSKVDVKGPKGDVSTPTLDVEMPSVQVDYQAPDMKLEGDLALAEKDVASRDRKFKMPKFKMPSFGVSAAAKAMDGSVEVTVPKVDSDVSLPSIQGDLKGSDLSIQLPSTDLDATAVQVGVMLPEATLPEGELPEAPATGLGMKGHVPKVQMPSIKMPKVDLKGPQLEIKGPKVDVKGLKGKVGTPVLDVEMPSMQMDIQAPEAKLEVDLALEKKDVASRDLKLKMPKFKMPSFGLSAPAKGLDMSLEVKVPKVEAEVALPSMQRDLKGSDLTIQLPSTDLDARAIQVGVTPPEATLPEGELPETPATGLGMKGHVPKVQIPSIKMPKVDLKGPKLDVKGPKVDMHDPKGEVSAPTLDMEMPSMQVDIQSPETNLEGYLALEKKDEAYKGSKFKMPKFKMPSFDLSAPTKGLDTSVKMKVPKVEAEVALPSIQGELKGSDLTIQLPSTDLDANAVQVDMTLPEAALPEGELPASPVTAAGPEGHLPELQMPSIKVPKVDLKGLQVDIKGTKVDVKGPEGEVSAPILDVKMPSGQVDIQASDAGLEKDLALADQAVSTRDSKFKAVDLDVSFPEKESEWKFQRPHFKFSKVFLPHKKSDKDSTGLEEVSGASLLSVSSKPSPESQGPSMSWATSSVDVPGFVTSDLPSAGLDRSSDPAGHAVFPGSADPTLTGPRGPFLPLGAGAECPQLSSCSPQRDVPSAGFESSAVLQAGKVIPVFPPAHQPGPEEPLPCAFHARVTFPKFHKPKFGFSGTTAAGTAAGTGLALLHPAEGVDSSGERALLTSVPASQPLSLGVPVSPVREEQLGPSLSEAPAEDVDHEGKGSPFKMPRLKLPSFSWSPKKEAVVTGDPGTHPEEPTLSLVLEPDQMHTQRGVQMSPTEVPTALPAEKEGEKGRLKKPAFALPRLSLSRLKASKGREDSPRGAVDAALSSTTGGCDSEATEKASHEGGGGDTGVESGPLEGDGGPIQVPQALVPGLSASAAKVEVSLSGADVHIPKRGLAVGGDSRESGQGHVSVNQPPGEGTAPHTPPQDTPAVESPEEGATAPEALADPQARWFRMPKVHMPGIRRSSSKARGALREQDAAQVDVPDAPAPTEAFSDPVSKVEASVSPWSSEAEAEATASESESHADVPRHHFEGPGLKLHLPAVPVCRSGLPSPGGSTHPAAGPLPLQMPRGRPSEAQAPPGEGCGEPLPRPGGWDLTKAEARTERWSFQPEGPLRLKASSTDVPSQVAVVSMDQLWEDSVLTVTFPKLKVPRFSFPASSSEADVFFPVVREVPCVEAGTEAAHFQESPGLWGASLLRATGTSVPSERPEGPDLSSVSKVRVHIQESWGESQEVTIGSWVTGECSGLGAPEAFSTRIVRESEIPACTAQLPSYGFSLLKGKIPEPPAQASLHPTAQDSAAGECPGGIPGGDAVPGDPQPNTGEPFEMISASANLPGPQALTSEVCSGLQPADSGSDEEPAEILEFPFDNSPEASTLLAGEDRAPKEKPEGKKSSGLLWSWLPNIGFSSTDETSAEARDAARRSAPIQTQPGARPDPEPPKKQEKAGWFRFPRLGFSSSPTKKSRSTEDEASLAEQKPQEETVTFFDARESFSPEEEEEEVAAGAAGARPGSRVMVASSARTELILLEHSKSAGEEPATRPTTE